MVNNSKAPNEGTDWDLGGVSVIGFSHQENNIPCQDAHAFRLTSHNEVIAAVADGAGSARLSHEGAQAFVNAIVDHLSMIGDKHPLNLKNAEFIRSAIIESITATRDELVSVSSTENPSDGETLSTSSISLRDFHATLVIAICGIESGAFYHVGNGVGVAFSSNNPETAEVSKPENGEYANETYFVTEKNWEDHLRMTPFSGSADIILLMSDGVSGMAMTKGCKEPAINFVSPLIKFLKNNNRETNELAVTNTVSKDSVRTITGDDKTLVWIIRSGNNKA